MTGRIMQTFDWLFLELFWRKDVLMILPLTTMLMWVCLVKGHRKCHIVEYKLF